MIEFDTFKLVVQFFVRCAFDPYHETYVDSEMQHSEPLQKTVAAVKEFHQERTDILSSLRKRCKRDTILTALFKSKRVHSFSSVPEGAICACSGEPISRGTTLVLVDKGDRHQQVKCVSKFYESMMYHFYELSHFQDIIVSRLHTNIPAFTESKAWAKQCCGNVSKVKFLYVQYCTHIRELESRKDE